VSDDQPTLAPETRLADKYVLVRHLATGGMAELYLARQDGLAGFQKDLVIKRILPRYADHTKVVRMFIDEARIAASLNHPNIVHIYDIGLEAGSWFIAMEYIQGENLWTIARRGIEAKSFLPLEHAVKVVSMVCEGLEYAHTRTGPDGRPLRIVHRDISPSNLLCTWDGIAKIVDFGIARAETQIREERGLVAGKCQYMAPEALRGEKADHRADLWSLGVVLWEMTLGRRLFKGRPDEVARRVLDDPVPPPTFIRHDYPPQLEQIVMRALEKHVDERYPEGAQMMQDLEDFLADARLRTSSLRIGRYLRDLFARPAAASPEDIARAAEFGRESSSDRADDAEELDFDRRPSLLAGISDRPGDADEEELPEIVQVSEGSQTQLDPAAADAPKAAPEPVSVGEARADSPSEPVILASRLEDAPARRQDASADDPSPTADGARADPAPAPPDELATDAQPAPAQTVDDPARVGEPEVSAEGAAAAVDPPPVEGPPSAEVPARADEPSATAAALAAPLPATGGTGDEAADEPTVAFAGSAPPAVPRTSARAAVDRQSRRPLLVALVLVVVAVAVLIGVLAGKAHSSPQFDPDHLPVIPWAR
jgi:serine/threonine protein kinase